LGSASGPTGREATRLVRAAVDSGVTVFDTADAYGAGASERALGRALVGRRDQVEIATKGGYLFAERSELGSRARRIAAPTARRLRQLRSMRGPGSPGRHAYRAQDFSPERLRAALESSLRRLGTDYVDVYQLHGPDRAHPELLPTLREFVDAGLARRIGIGAERLDAALSWIVGPDDRSGPGVTSPVDVVQVPFGPLDPYAASLVLPPANALGVDVWARGVFGGGLMAADRASAAAIDDPIDQVRLDRLRSMAEDLGLDLFELAVAFVRSFPEVSVTILGMSSVEHLRRNVDLVRSADALPSDVVRRVCELSDRIEGRG
jgi:aryl-alcohol dehydrogenase-like predicted oxidoreductase